MTQQRHSRQKDILTDILRNTKSHPTADAVYQSAREQMPNISLGTVYRNLSRLAADGEILRLDVGDGSDRFDADTTPHTHFVCRVCGKVSDIYHDFSDEILKSAAAFTDCRLTSCSVTISGICQACLKNASDTPVTKE